MPMNLDVNYILYKDYNNMMSCTYTTVLCCICATLLDIYTSWWQA